MTMHSLVQGFGERRRSAQAAAEELCGSAERTIQAELCGVMVLVMSVLVMVTPYPDKFHQRMLSSLLNHGGACGAGAGAGGTGAGGEGTGGGKSGACWWC